jgi:DNA-binding MarR family transcriptional regulator
MQRCSPSQLIVAASESAIGDGMLDQSLDQTVSTLQQTIIALVRLDCPDLSTRQLGIFLICYEDDGPHTPADFAKYLGISKPAIGRAIDRLSQFDFVRRNHVTSDRRRVHVERTMKGSAFLHELRSIMSEAKAVAMSPRSHQRA